MSDGYWYLGSPYSAHPDGIHVAFAQVVEARGLLIRAVVPCFSPIIHSHMVALMCGMDPRDHSIWMPSERPMLDPAKGLIVLMLPGYERSQGLSEERYLFNEAGKPVVWMRPGVVPKGLR